eukprot:369415-Prymnesium_polylepis.1
MDRGTNTAIGNKKQFVVYKTGWNGPDTSESECHKTLYAFEMTSDEKKKDIPPAFLAYSTLRENSSSFIYSEKDAASLILAYSTATKKHKTSFSADLFEKKIVDKWENGEAVFEEQRNRELMKNIEDGKNEIS